MIRHAGMFEAMSTINDRIRERRRALNISQSELARRVGVKYQTVSWWEKGVDGKGRTIHPRMTIIEKLADSLNVSQSWLLTGEEEPGELDPHERQLIKLFRDMEPRWKDALLQQANALHNLAKPEKSRANPYSGVRPPPPESQD